MEGGKGVREEGLLQRDLGDVVLSWTIEDILNEELYKVEKVPNTFMSVKHYFESCTAPLIDETRSELCSCLELLSEAPFSNIQSMEEAKPPRKLIYYIDVDFWQNGSGCGGSDTYKARNGDLFILSSMKPEVVEDLSRYGVTYCLALVTEIEMDEELQKGLKVKTSRSIDIVNDMGNYSFAIFLANITTNIQIWNALGSEKGMNNNFDIIKEVLHPRPVDDAPCDACISGQSDHWWTKFSDLFSFSLNHSQIDAVQAAISTVQCKHSHYVKLIWGPPGTGKTKTVSAILWALMKMRCRIVTCASTNIAVLGVCSRLLQLVNNSQQHDKLNGSSCSLGDIVLFGNKDCMEFDDELHDIYLDYRVDQLSECFAPLSGWKHRISLMIRLLEDGISEYDIFLENENPEDSMSFYEFIRNRFNASAVPLGNCIRKLWIHLPSTCISSQNSTNLSALLKFLESFGSLLSNGDVTNEELKEVFLHENSRAETLLSMGDFVSPNLEVSAGKALDGIRMACLHILRVIQGTLNLPHAAEKNWIRKFCLRNASLIFCTASSSSYLHYMEVGPLDVLVIDEAAQLKECESAIPLRLRGLRHAILVGDECQLPSLVKSKVCVKAGFGRSLFTRLMSLGYHKHLLNTQYRMHPSISFFPNARFYEKQILDGPNVKDPNYERRYPGCIYGAYAFINITDGREELDDIGKSQKNMVEVAVILHMIRTLFKSWDGTGQRLSIGVVSPYSSQVNAIKEKVGKKYSMYNGFHVRVKSIDGFQGEEDDVIILSTVSSNNSGSIGILADVNRTNVALTRARHCLWILGNAVTLVRSGSIWEALVHDAQDRKCFYNSCDDSGLAEVILKVKHELDQLDDLFNSDSVLLSTARWKVLFSDDFRKSFAKLKTLQVKREVIQMLLRLADGFRSRRNLDLGDSFQLARMYRVRELYLIWTVDIVKCERYIQVLRIWDLLPMAHIPRLVKRLDNIFSMYTDAYIHHCKAKCVEGKVETPMSWKTGHDIIRYKKLCKHEMTEEANPEHVGDMEFMENSKVSESLLLMKFYALSSGVVKHLLTSTDGTEMDIPFELNDQEEEIVRFPKSTFILGRSGTGKTTILTMKLIQKEQQYRIAADGFCLARDDFAEAAFKPRVPSKDIDLNPGNFLRQVFVTVSPKLCSAIRSHVCRLKRFASGGEFSDAVSVFDMHDIGDSLTNFVDIPDSFVDLPQKHYPLVITFQKFLMMLDGTFRESFFDKFYGEMGPTSVERTVSKSLALHAFIRNKEVNYERFVGSYWSHFNAQLTKKLVPATVFTQIISHIKGGLEAGMAHDGKLSREDYIMQSEKRFSTLNREMRESIYDIFLDYEKKKQMNAEFDLSDFVMDLYRRLSHDSYLGDKLEFVYIDEVQDLTMRQIALFKYVCKNVLEGFVFAGDTAQTIARGIDFRFEDIRSLFYTEFLSEFRSENSENKREREIQISEKFQLNQNFRTHAGILKVAQSIVDLLLNFFPMCVDKLTPETSLIYGEAPVLLDSGNDENAIITIFGNSGNAGCSANGFGADQVILVRDDCAKKQIFDHVGKQALVLTIVECKGLEFQDVLLYNFFGASPLKNQWRVVYQFMKNKGQSDSTLPRSFPSFDEARHNLLCSELKQLYVAITRTRQRLWICESTDEYCKPMFDYWKSLCLVQVRHLDSSLAQAMRTASSPEDWRFRGIKLFNEGNFEMATMCFERAGDKYRENWAKAAGLCATADRIISTNFEMGEMALKNAAEIYVSIGKAETAAACFIKLKDFRKAGMIYLEKCGKSRLEDAGDCFAIAECWSLAADAYAKAKCFSKCLSICSKGKLFDTGLQFIEQWKGDSFSDEQKFPEVDDIKISYLESCALHYLELGDCGRMMAFVKAFNSMDLIRPFLKSRNLLDELLMMEVETGNFLEAANISRMKGNILFEAEMLEKASHFEKATRLILFHVILNSLWAPGSKGWPLKNFIQKEELLMKAKLLAKQVSNSFYDSVCSETDLLSDRTPTLSNMSKHLNGFRKCQNVRMEIFSARVILDVHRQSEPSKYSWELKLVSDVEKQTNEMISQNHLSVETLMHVWNLWKGMILNVLSYLRLLETPDENDFLRYEEFCLEYLGVRKQDNQNIYVVLNPEASWIRSSDGSFLQKDRKLVCMNAQQFMSHAQHYWSSELFSVGMMVLERLELLHIFSSKKRLSLYAQGRVILSISEVAKFLKELELLELKHSTGKTQRFLSLSRRFFCDIIFPLDWRSGTMESMIALHENAIAREILEEYLIYNINPKNGKLTNGQIGRLVRLLFITGRLTDELFERIKMYLDHMPPWKEYIEQMKTFLDSGFGRIPLICKFQEALESTFETDWRRDFDYVSPHCFIYLVECLLFLASSCQGFGGFFFTTKSSLFEMLHCLVCKGYMGACLVLPDTLFRNSLARSLVFVAGMARKLLRSKNEIRQWIKRSSLPTSYYSLLVLQLVIVFYLAHLNAGWDVSEIGQLLSIQGIFKDLPRAFSEKLHQAWVSQICDRVHFLRIFADALGTIGNPLVVVCSQDNCSEFSELNAFVIRSEDIRCEENVIAILFPKNQETTQRKETAHETINSNSNETNLCSSIGSNKTGSKNHSSSSTIPEKENQELDIESRDDDNSCILGKYRHFWKIVDVLQSGKLDNFSNANTLQCNPSGIKSEVEDAIYILDTAITWLNEKGLPKDCDVALLGELRSMHNELKLLPMMRDEAVETDSSIRVLVEKLQERRPRLQPLMDSLFLQDQNTSEEASQSEHVTETQGTEQNITERTAEAIDAVSNNQSKSNKREGNKKSKKRKGKSKK